AVVGLIGTLGAGKTHLVGAVAQACGIAPQDTGSPTFVLIREYHGSRVIYHFDTYRLHDEDEFIELGPEEYFYGDGLSFVEWSERVESVLPPDRLDIEIEITGNDSRLFRLVGHGDEFSRLACEIVASPALT
ncbi:MAG: tRNA (adenosine(37)-N6)-threonylcarbamoyltransferase complex ATPase subunit type 1 TsaE, partial [Planctomycetia bacterium]|nr:tRNA (adenosine(37)-N6)-threonylcarbamoyltransferase complex ATPase subunit type 1 TsaE [Planctomycetia bacterium]